MNYRNRLGLAALTMTASLVFACGETEGEGNSSSGGTGSSSSGDVSSSRGGASSSGSGSGGVSSSSGGSSSGGAVVPVTATITGSVPEGVQQVFLAWSVSSGSPDYAYKYGTATIADGTFTINLDSLPEEALNVFDGKKLGVGFVVGLASAEEIADGRLTDDAIFDNAFGGSKHVLFRSGAFTEDDWANDFPDGQVGCGTCVTEEEGFDSFAPSECSSIELQDGGLNSCNWS